MYLPSLSTSTAEFGWRLKFDSIKEKQCFLNIFWFRIDGRGGGEEEEEEEEEG
jgi:hypothetical protein